MATPYPRTGQVWRSRDKRDEGLKVTVLAVDEPNSRVQIQRFRKSWVALRRWASEYEFVR